MKNAVQPDLLEKGLHFSPVFLNDGFFEAIGLENPASERFNPTRLGLLQGGDFGLKIDLLRNERIFELLEFREVDGAIGEGAVEAVDLGLHGRQFCPQALDLSLPGR